MIRRIVRYRVATESIADAVDAVEAFVSAVAGEPGTLRYDAYRHVDDEGTEFVHTMVFADEAARDHHVATDHVKAFVARLYPLCDELPVFTDLELVAASRSASPP